MQRLTIMTAMAIGTGVLCLAVVMLATSDKTEPGAASALPLPRGKIAVVGPAALSRNAEPSVASGSPLACDAPHIAVGETTSRQQVHEFELKNVSHERVRITTTRKSCGCVKRDLTKYELARGETSKVVLDFPIRAPQGMVSDFFERLELYVNDQHESPAVVLSVGGRYIPPAYRVGEGIHVQLPTSGPMTFNGSIEVRVNTAHGFRILELESVGPLPHESRISPGELLPGGEEERFTIEVSGTVPAGTSLPATGAVIARVNSDDLPELRIPVVVYKERAEEVQIMPDRLAFGVLEPGAKVTRTVVIAFPEGSDCIVEKAEPSGDGIRAEVDVGSDAKRAALVRCELDATKLRGAVTQELVITVRSHGGQQDIFKLPMSGYVKPAPSEQARKTSVDDHSN